MASLANVLKNEIIRLARKEAKAATKDLSTALKAERNRVASMEKEIAALRGAMANSSAPATPTAAPTAAPVKQGRKFAGRRVSALRKKHKMAQSTLGKLVGVGTNTVWLWEKKGTTPQMAQQAKLNALSVLTGPEMKAALTAAGLDGARKKPGRKPGTKMAKKPAAKKTAKKATKKAAKKVAKKAPKKAAKKAPKKAAAKKVTKKRKYTKRS